MDWKNGALNKGKISITFWPKNISKIFENHWGSRVQTSALFYDWQCL